MERRPKKGHAFVTARRSKDVLIRDSRHLLIILVTVTMLSNCNREEPPEPRSTTRQVSGSSEAHSSPLLPNILLIVLDTTRAEAISAYGNADAYTPVVDELAAQGVLFGNARAISSWTLPNHASLFTGLYSHEHNAHHETDRLGEEQVTLAELLSSSHSTVGITENAHVIRDKGFAQGFERYEETWRDRSGPEFPTIDVFRSWYETRDRARPFFAFVNIMTPHLPYTPPPRWQDRFFSHEEISSGIVSEMMGFREVHARLFMSGGLQVSPRAFAMLERLYFADTAYADERVGQLIETLGRDGMLDDTIVIVVGDHGENIGEHGLAEHQFGLYETVLRVPFLIRYPAVFEAGTIRRAPVQLTDVAPTVLDILDLDPRLWAHMSGVSLVDREPPEDRALLAELMRPVQQRPLFARANPGFDFDKFDKRIKSLQVGRFKIILSERGEIELYDMEQDPDELTNIVDRNPDVARRLRAQLMQIVPSWDPTAAPGQPDLDAETREQLRSLGYIQ